LSTRLLLHGFVLPCMVLATLSVRPAIEQAQAVVSTHPSAIVDVAAFRDQGMLAFRSGGILYVLDGSAGTLHRFGAVGSLSEIAWSADGNWLAYLTSNTDDPNLGSLIVAHADGSDRHRIASLPGAATAFQWAPTSDTLAIDVPGAKPFEGGIYIASPASRPTKLVDGGSPEWSPDGEAIAYVAEHETTDANGRGADLRLISRDGGRSRLVQSVEGGGIKLAGWWPNGKGLLYWFDADNSASLAADGMPLRTIAIGGMAQRLATTLGMRDWVIPLSRKEQVLFVSGAGREVWHDKALALCDLSPAGCVVPPIRTGTVPLDPAVSPDQSHIVYISARDLGAVGGFGSTAALNDWVRSRTLWLTNGYGDGAHQLSAAGSGIYWPHWSSNGKHLLFIRDRSVWLVGINGSKPTRVIAGPLEAPETYPFGYYGFVSWDSILAWWKGGT
jgi:dipeptidyl aminopeptidase/acylaminoacyl peptidase